ncbi:MAG TPA: serine/threonine-protein kinase [Acidimicrobiales bacterium]|nr:serine/threonine-protein kinase [Acidimicrobiales bacterium]
MAGLAPGVPRALAGRYRLVRLLARGGMAEVWEGRDDVLSRPVAVKVLLPHLAVDPFLRERFRREAVTAARLVHPGIVAIFDAGVEITGSEDGGRRVGLRSGWPRDERARLGATWPEQPSTAFIIMELVPGETLRDLMLRCGRMPPELAIAIASQVADALAHAHAQGLVHRDIKPANVLLRDEGAGAFRVKVADFGIAKAVATSGDLTANGTFLGTPKYVSPEQVQGKEPDGRADVYSLGVVMFEMLAGQPPFQEGSDMATALAHVQKDAPRLADLRPELPGPLSELVASTLVKDPRQRVGSALALAAALNAVSKRIGAPAVKPGGSLQLGRAAGWVLSPPSPGAPRAVLGLGHSPAAPAPPPTSSPGSGSLAARPSALPAASSPLGASCPPGTSSPPLSTVDDGAPGASGTDGSSAEAAEDAAKRVGPAFRGLADHGPGRKEPARGTRTGQVPNLGRPARRPRRVGGRVTAAVVLCLLLAGVSVVMVVLEQGAGPSRPRSSGASGHSSSAAVLPPLNRYPALAVKRVYELAENGNHANDDLSGLGNVISNDPDAYWESVKYLGPNFGNYGGLGLVLQLAAPQVLHELDVTTPMQGWSAETFVAEKYSSALRGWGQPTWRLWKVNGDQRFALEGRRGSWVLFWMLDPGPGEQAVVDKLAVH